MESLKKILNESSSCYFQCFGKELEPFGFRLDYIALYANEQFFLLAENDWQESIPILKTVFSDNQVKKVCYDVKNNLHFLRLLGIHTIQNFTDVMVFFYIKNSSEFGSKSTLAKLVKKHTQHNLVEEEDILGKGVKRLDFKNLESVVMSDYSRQYAQGLYHLYQQQVACLEQEDGTARTIANEIDYPLSIILGEIENSGMLIDPPELLKQSKDLSEQLESIENQSYQLAGESFNLNSPKQIQEVLYDKLLLFSGKKTSTGQKSTSEAVLQKLALEHELPGLILQYRSLSKLKSTYTDALLKHTDENERVHTRLNQTITSTGRLSSSNPNLQNIPIRTQQGRAIRKAFIAPPGHAIISADYSQIELRIMAHISKDERLIDSFMKGEDIHRATAKEIFDLDEVSSEQRRFAKSINFGLIYGMSAFGLSNQLKITTEEADAYINAYFTKYPKIKSYMDSVRLLAKEQGYVETLAGRHIHLPLIKAANQFLRKEAERAAINAPLQGSAADIMKKAMIAVSQGIAPDQAKMVMQVHDELLFEVPENAVAEVTPIIKSCMEGVMELAVDLIVDIGVGANWEEAH